MTGFRQAQVEAKAALPLSIVLRKLMSIRYGVGIAVSRQP